MELKEKDNNLMENQHVLENEKNREWIDESLEQLKTHQANRVRKKQISFRVSEAEYEKLSHNAGVKGISVAKLVQSKALGMELKNPVMDLEQSKKAIKLLANLSNNVNQIARACNVGVYDPSNQNALKAEINHFRKELQEVWQLLR